MFQNETYFRLVEPEKSKLLRNETTGVSFCFAGISKYFVVNTKQFSAMYIEKNTQTCIILAYKLFFPQHNTLTSR